MGVATGCGFKEISRFLHTTYPTPLVSVLFCSSIPTFLFIFLNVFRSLYIYIPGTKLLEYCDKWNVFVNYSSAILAPKYNIK